MLGSGAFGEVRSCTHIETGNKRAVKILTRANLEPKEEENISNEIRNLIDLNHPNILKIYEFFVDNSSYYIVTDICAGGELFDEIVKRKRF